jgi:hypothetical protein
VSQRQAIGLFAARETFCDVHHPSGRAPESRRKLGVLSFNVFLELNDILRLMKYEIVAVRDGRWFDSKGRAHWGFGDEAARLRDAAGDKSRFHWGLRDSTILVAANKKTGGIDEMTL